VSPEKARLIGLLAATVIENSLRYAHPTGIPVQVDIDCRRHADGRLQISIGDDGVGLPEGMQEDAVGGAGFREIRSLARLLNADLKMESDSLGFTVCLSLPSSDVLLSQANSSVVDFSDRARSKVA